MWMERLAWRPLCGQGDWCEVDEAICSCSLFPDSTREVMPTQHAEVEGGPCGGGSCTRVDGLMAFVLERVWVQFALLPLTLQIDVF